MNTRKIYCVGCESEVNARLTNGKEIYSHRADLSSLPFWKCDVCGGYVGCHHKTSKPNKPLGVIPTPLIRRLRNQIHDVLDPLWQSGAFSRKKVYSILKDSLGREYHTADLRSADECEKILAKLYELKQWAVSKGRLKA